MVQKEKAQTGKEKDTTNADNLNSPSLSSSFYNSKSIFILYLSIYSKHLLIKLKAIFPCRTFLSSSKVEYLFYMYPTDFTRKFLSKL